MINNSIENLLHTYTKRIDYDGMSNKNDSSYFDISPQGRNDNKTQLKSEMSFRV